MMITCMCYAQHTVCTEVNVEFIWTSLCCQYFPSSQSNRPMIQFHLAYEEKLKK